MAKNKKQKREGSQNYTNIPSNESASEDEWERTCVTVRKGLIKQLKDISYWERKKMRETLSDAIEGFLLYKQHIKPVPIEPVQPVSLLEHLKKSLKPKSEERSSANKKS